MNSRIHCILTVVGATLILPAQAQTVPDEIKKQVATACNNTVAAAMEKLRPYLGDHAALRDKPDLVLVMPVANFNAFADYKKQRILIPLMLCVETWYLLDGMMQMHRDPQLREKIQQYIAYLSKRQRDSLAKNTGFDTIPVLPFHDFAGVAYPQLSDAESRKSLAVRENIMVESMAFIIGHEFGHLVLRHKPYNEISSEAARKQEADADEFSARLLKKAGISVLAAIPVIQRFLANEPYSKRVVGGAMTHPRSECRMERIVASTEEVEDLLKNPDRRREYEAASGLSASDYAKTMRGLREDCHRSPLGGTPLARIIEGRKDGFENLRDGSSDRISGQRVWNATVSLDGKGPCKVWEGTSDRQPSVSCSVYRSKDGSQAESAFAAAVEMVKYTVPSGWRRDERESTRVSRLKSVEFNGPSIEIRVVWTTYSSTGNNDVNVFVSATR